MSRKDERQTEIIERWLALRGVGTLEAVTGFGKTRVALRIIERMLVKHPASKTLVVVPSKKLYEDWVKPGGHLAKWHLTNVEVRVINTAVKSDWQVDLLILDE